MSNGNWRVKPSEIERTVKTLQKTGLHVRTVEVSVDGTIKITVTDSNTEPDAESPENLRKLL